MNFAEELDDLLNRYFAERSRPLKELHENAMSVLELKLMAMGDETPEDLKD